MSLCRTLVARQRKQTIAESKFLGGDMEHTHLVKGLDFALLQKVTSGLIITGFPNEYMILSIDLLFKLSILLFCYFDFWTLFRLKVKWHIPREKLKMRESVLRLRDKERERKKRN